MKFMKKTRKMHNFWIDITSWPVGVDWQTWYVTASTFHEFYDYIVKQSSNHANTGFDLVEGIGLCDMQKTPKSHRNWWKFTFSDQRHLQNRYRDSLNHWPAQIELRHMPSTSIDSVSTCIIAENVENAAEKLQKTRRKLAETAQKTQNVAPQRSNIGVLWFGGHDETQ